jgi:transcriptional regulator with XRE-family HTH domain
VARWEHGDMPHRSSVRKIAAALGLSLKELLPSHASARYSDEVLRTVMNLKRAGYSSEEVSTTMGVSVRHVHEVYAGSSRSYLLDTTMPDIRDLIASCADADAAIRSARLHRGLKQHQLSWAISAHETTIFQWESGRRRPGANAVRRIADALGLLPGELLSVEPSA